MYSPPLVDAEVHCHNSYSNPAAAAPNVTSCFLCKVWRSFDVSGLVNLFPSCSSEWLIFTRGFKASAHHTFRCKWSRLLQNYKEKESTGGFRPGYRSGSYPQILVNSLEANSHMSRSLGLSRSWIRCESGFWANFFSRLPVQSLSSYPDPTLVKSWSCPDYDSDQMLIWFWLRLSFVLSNGLVYKVAKLVLNIVLYCIS